jgi:hypothetical protein
VAQDDPRRPAPPLQAAALVEYAVRRRADVEQAHQALPWLARRRTDRVESPPAMTPSTCSSATPVA